MLYDCLGDCEFMNVKSPLLGDTSLISFDKDAITQYIDRF